LDEFGVSKIAKDGKKPRCRTCTREDWKAYSAQRQDKVARKTYYETYAAVNKPKIAARMKQYDAMRKAQGLREHQQFPERTRARMKQYYADHREDFQKYRETHREERQQNWADWAAKNAESLTHYQETHREQTRARGQAWARNFPEKNAARVQRRRARKVRLPDTWTPEQLAFMLDYWQHSCAVCGNPKGLFWSLAHDHWIPLASPECPGTIASNMIPLCHGESGCNNSKHSTEPHAWLIKRFGAKRARKIEQSIAAYFAQVALIFPSP